MYYRLDDDEVLAAGGRPLALAEPRPQLGLPQHGGIGYEVVLKLDAPVLHVIEEVDDLHFLHDRFYLPEQMIVQEIPSFPSVPRATQPTDVEQVLNVPALRFHDEDRVLKLFLENVALLLKPEEQVSSSAAEVVQEQVIAQPLPGVRVPRQRVHVAESRVSPASSCPVVDVPFPDPGRSSSVASERNVEQVVNAPVRCISSAVPERIMEQVLDVPVSRTSPSRRAHEQSTGSSAAWLDSSEGRNYGVFRTFSSGRKVRGLCVTRLRTWSGTPAHGRRGLMSMVK